MLAAGLADAVLARALCSLLRQLVSSDGNKSLFVDAGGLELLAGLMTTHGASPAVLEQALGLLTNLTLRNPAAAEKVGTSAQACVVCVHGRGSKCTGCALRSLSASLPTLLSKLKRSVFSLLPLTQALNCGCLDAVLELMRVMLAAGPSCNSSGGNGKENRGTTAAQRQACMALRNIAVR